MTGSPFDRIDEGRLRSGWGVKWGSLAADEIGAWVADMDFGVPPAVRRRIIECAEREDFGYPYWPGEDPVVAAFEDRMDSRYGWQPASGRTRVFSDLLQVLQIMVEHTTAVGDGVAVHVPAYPPFLASIARARRRIVPIPMRYDPHGWGFDVDGLADRLRAAGCRLLVLVNPQNPTGRVFRRDELRVLADVAEELDLVVLADEIHADLTYPGHRHIPFASLDAATADRTVTATSATKAFNIAALRCAVAHVGPRSLRASLDAAPWRPWRRGGRASRGWRAFWPCWPATGIGSASGSPGTRRRAGTTHRRGPTSRGSLRQVRPPRSGGPPGWSSATGRTSAAVPASTPRPSSA